MQYMSFNMINKNDNLPTFSVNPTPPSNNQSVSIFRMKIPPPLHTQQSAIVTAAAPTADPKKKVMKWGEPTWFLFHTLAEKINEDSFPKIRIEFLNNIFAICANLPCPVCAEHATQYLTIKNFKNIKTKQELKDFFFNFHNVVNNRKNYPTFSYDDLDNKYSKANTVNIIYNFVYYFQDSTKNINMIANDLYRQSLITKFKTWINANFVHFT